MKVKTETVLKLTITGTNVDVFKKIFKRLNENNNKLGFNKNDSSQEERDLIQTLNNKL